MDATPAQRTWTVYTTAPPAPTIVGAPRDLSPSTSATFAFAHTEPAIAFECKLDSGAFAPCGSPVEYTALPQGVHTFSVRARDAAGNVSAEATRSWTVDTIAPNTAIGLKPPLSTKLRTAKFTFRAIPAAGATFQCKLDKGRWVACKSPRTYRNLKKGLHTFYVRAVDEAGNKDKSPAKRTWRVK